MTLTYVQGHSSIWNQKLVSNFLQIKVTDLDGMQSIATVCWFVEAHAKFVLQ